MMRNRQLLHLRAGMMGVLVALAAMLTPRATWAQAGKGNPKPKVEAKVTKLQWKRPADTAYQDVTGTLTVLKGTTVRFKAVKDDPKKSWSTGKPEWSGTSGASGSGETKDVTFDTLSSSTTDYKTVIVKASGPSSATANVIVYELTPSTKAEDDFPNRSQTKFGVGENAKLEYKTQPTGVTVDLQWRLESGPGRIPPNSDIFTAGGSDGTAKIKAIISSGPSKDKYKTLDRNIVTPTGFRFAKELGTRIWHPGNGIAGVGFAAVTYLLPKDVSFLNIEYREGTDQGDGSGYFARINGKEHPIRPWGGVDRGNAQTGNLVSGDDKVGTGLCPPPFSDGRFEWQIPQQWQLSSESGNPRDLPATADHIQTIDGAGTTTIQKGGVGPFVKALGDPPSDF